MKQLLKKELLKVEQIAVPLAYAVDFDGTLACKSNVTHPMDFSETHPIDYAVKQLASYVLTCPEHSVAIWTARVSWAPFQESHVPWCEDEFEVFNGIANILVRGGFPSHALHDLLWWSGKWGKPWAKVIIDDHAMSAQSWHSSIKANLLRRN